jgi:hypothetical protein
MEIGEKFHTIWARNLQPATCNLQPKKNGLAETIFSK